MKKNEKIETFRVVADDIYNEAVFNQRTRNSGALTVTYEVAVIKFLHLISHMLINMLERK